MKLDWDNFRSWKWGKEAAAPVVHEVAVQRFHVFCIRIYMMFYIIHTIPGIMQGIVLGRVFYALSYLVIYYILLYSLVYILPAGKC